MKTKLQHIGEAIVSSISILLNLPVFFIAAKFVTDCGRQQHAEILSASLRLESKWLASDFGGPFQF